MNARRWAIMVALRALLRTLTHWEVRGAENLPVSGPLLVAFNHVAHLDGPIILASLPWEVEGMALADLYHVPVTGLILRLYGTIPVHRNGYDRESVRRALSVLSSGGVLALAPEARRSLTHSLEQGRTGAAYLALRGKAPILPIGLTGSEGLAAACKHLHRPRLVVNIGPAFHLKGPLLTGAARQAQLCEARDEIMRRIARLLPLDYRGAYA
jgi:1-acyl-sn-glycerol-3-phosphate acyltransferase